MARWPAGAANLLRSKDHARYGCIDNDGAGSTDGCFQFRPASNEAERGFASGELTGSRHCGEQALVSLVLFPDLASPGVDRWQRRGRRGCRTAAAGGEKGPRNLAGNPG